MGSPKNMGKKALLKQMTAPTLGLFHHERVFIFTPFHPSNQQMLEKNGIHYFSSEFEGQPTPLFKLLCKRGPGGGETPTLKSLPGCLDTLIWS